MPFPPRFDHEVVQGVHVVTSPDVQGLSVTASTREEAERQAYDVLAFIKANGLDTVEGRADAIKRAAEHV